MKRFKFRAECLNDVFLFFNYCPQGSVKKIECNKTEGIEWAPDVEVSFESKLTLSDFRQICAIIEDCHVMLQTIQPIVSYTGERDYEL
jgi:hypothetical protein